MKFKIAVDELQNIFSKLVHVTMANESDNRAMIMAEGDDAGLRFKSTTGNVTLIVEADKYELEEKGKHLFRFRDVKAYISKYFPLIEGYGTDGFQFEISGTEGRLKTKTLYKDCKPVSKTLRFESFPVVDFPNLKPFQEPQFIINSDIFKKGVNRVLHCITPTEVRQALTGLNLTVMGDKVVFTGTNGIKLTEFSLSMNADVEQKSYLLKFELASVLRSVLDDDAQVFVRVEGATMYFKSNRVYFCGPLIMSYKYPDYKAMFNLEKTIQIPRLGFYDTVRTVMDVLDPEDNSRLTVQFEGDTLQLKNDRVESDQKFDIPFENSLSVDVNGMFLESLLRDFIGDNIEINFKDGNNYIIFKSVEFPNHTSLITVLRKR